MAATLTHDRFSDPGWVFERKYDGIRLLGYRRGGVAQLLSRTRRPQAIPAVAAAIEALPIGDAILDGELSWSPPFRYHVFDVPWLDGRDLTGLELDARHELLRELPLRAPLVRVEQVRHARPWELAGREGWEGVVAKRRDSPYESRRSPHWLKMKCEATQELVVGGFTDPRGSRVGLGSLLVGYFDGADFVYAGKLGTGFDAELLRDLRARLDRLEVPTPPFTRATGLPRVRAHWARPEIVVQVAFLQWTRHGKLRHPRLVGLRPDKAPRDVVRETPIRALR